MKKALCIIDYQNDLVHSDGKVAERIKGGSARLTKAQLLAPEIQKLIELFSKKDQVIVSIQSDYGLNNYTGHYKEKRAEKLYADTAIIGTWGYDLFNLVLPKNSTTVTKHYFDGFYETNLHDVLQDNDVDEVFLCGVNTDVCVVHTAIGAAWRGYKTHLLEDLTETISPNKTQAIEYLADIVDVDIMQSKDVF